MEQFNANRIYCQQRSAQPAACGGSGMNNMSGFPIAMCYVPWQAWERTYEPAVALKRGTIFPSLDLPFLGGGYRR